MATKEERLEKKGSGNEFQWVGFPVFTYDEAFEVRRAAMMSAEYAEGNMYQ